MKREFFCMLILALLFLSCNHRPVKKLTIKIDSLKDAFIPQVAKIENKDTLIINTKCALRVDLSTVQLDRLHKKYGDEAFYSGADDNVYYSSVADSIIAANHLALIANKQQKYVKFIRSNGLSTLIKIDTLPQPANYYFFEPFKEPYCPDITSIEDEFKKYFN